MTKVNAAIDGIKTSGQAAHETRRRAARSTRRGPRSGQGARSRARPEARTRERDAAAGHRGRAPCRASSRTSSRNIPRPHPSRRSRVMSYFDVDPADPSRDTLPALHTLRAQLRGLRCVVLVHARPDLAETAFFVHSATTLGHVRHAVQDRAVEVPRLLPAHGVMTRCRTPTIRWKIYHEGHSAKHRDDAHAHALSSRTRGYAPMDEFLHRCGGRRRQLSGIRPSSSRPTSARKRTTSIRLPT